LTRRRSDEEASSGSTAGEWVASPATS
jgi:hypothetical protein